MHGALPAACSKTSFLVGRSSCQPVSSGHAPDYRHPPAYDPGGKEQLAAEAIALAGHRYEQLLRAALHASHPADAVASWVELAAAELEASSWADGCPVATVTLETAHTSTVLAGACQAALGSWHAAITAPGIADADAVRLASLVLAGIEGGLLLARAYRSPEPLRAVGDELTAILHARIPDASRPLRPEPPAGC